MLVTEKEAAEKWCPMARSFAGGVDAAVNRHEDGGPDCSCFCLGSKCMAWQWHKTNVKVSELSPYDQTAHGTALNALHDVDLVAAWRTYGYCGAFGKVEP